MRKGIIAVCSVILVALIVLGVVFTVKGSGQRGIIESAPKTAAEAKEKLEILKGKSDGAFPYLQKLADGETEPIARRLTVDEAKKLVSEAGSFEEAKKALEARQAFPDFVGKGEKTAEYWFDDAGTEKVVVVEGEKKIYTVNAKGKAREIK